MAEKMEHQMDSLESISTEDELNELSDKLDSLDDEMVASSTVTGELFNLSEDGEDIVIKRIENIEDESAKDEALFRIANLYYRVKQDIDAALSKAGEIDSKDEKTRCLVQLAVAVLNTENNLELADSIIAQAEQDGEGYIKYYQSEKQKFIDKNQK
ncbi:MAG: hypothetical protein Q7K65_05505 [Candidatus Buchananbacteria bacterium]|nr:hypothetical protein [Candidatus Buchananbacteria bacterium]